MKDNHINGWNLSSAKILRYSFNIVLVLLMVLSNFSVALADDNSADASGERFAEDPYESWGDGFLDFIPPNPAPIEEIQPDGTTFTAYLTPAETGGQFETADDYTVVQNDDGWWTYAVAGPSGEAVASDLIVNQDSPEGLDKQIGQTESRWLDENGNDTRDAVFQAVHDVQSPNGSTFAAQEAAAGVASLKNYHYIVILADFQDVKFESYQTPQYFKDQISGLGTSSTGTISDLYYEMSYGQFLPEFDVIGPFTLPYNMYTYDYQLSGGRSVTGMITDLGPQLLTLGVNFWDQYDNDRVVYSSGGTQYRSVDMVVVLHAGPDKAATGINGQVWSHASTANYNTGT